MSWNFLTFALPALSFSKMLRLSNPASYEIFDRFPPSKRSNAVRAIAERILQAENSSSSCFYGRIQQMLQQSREDCTVPSFVANRIKVFDAKFDTYPVWTTGTDADQGKYYIALDPHLNAEVLPWIVARELFHILNEDPLKKAMVKTVVSFAAAAIFVFGLRWPLVFSSGGVVLTNYATHALYSYQAANAADDFAIRNCSKEQLEKIANVFEHMKLKGESNVYFSDVRVDLFDSSDDTRIAKIQNAIRASVQIPLE